MRGTNPESSLDEVIHKLIDQYADELFRFTRRGVQSDADAKDLVQDTFVRAFERWGKFRHEASEKTWLYQILRNLIRDYHRRNKVRERYVQTWIPDVPPDDHRVEMLDIQRALTQLSLEFRQVVCLRFIDDFSVEDTASALGWTEAKVRTTQHRALKKLQALLKSTNLHQTDAVWTGR